MQKPKRPVIEPLLTEECERDAQAVRDAVRRGPNGELSNQPLVFMIWDRDVEGIIQCGYWPRDEKIGKLVLKKLASESETYGESEDEDDFPLPLIASFEALAYDEDTERHTKRICNELKLQNIEELGELYMIANPGLGRIEKTRLMVKRSQLHSQLNERFFETG